MADVNQNFESLSNTGRFMCAVSYAQKNPEVKLQDDCTDVVHYRGGHIIQLLKSGEFMVNESFSSRSLDEAETYLFSPAINKKMNDS